MDKDLLIVANWKSNKTNREAFSWLTFFNENKDKINFKNKEIVLCPSFTSLSICRSFIKDNNLPISLGAQDLSEFSGGPYTGEVSASQVKELCSYVLIGHSERKRYFSETQDKIKRKVSQAEENNLDAILCVQNENDFIVDAKFIAYEPPFAISTFGVGRPDAPEHVEKVFSALANKTGAKLLYGGSLALDNIGQYSKIKSLRGFLLGGVSLDPREFINLLLKC